MNRFKVVFKNPKQEPKYFNSYTDDTIKAYQIAEYEYMNIGSIDHVSICNKEEDNE